MKPNTCEFASSAAQLLREAASKLDECPAPRVLGPWEIAFASLERDGEQMLKDIRQQITEEDRCIYIFELTDSSASGKLCSNLKRAKENNPKSFAAPKINTANASSGCVYVGSSFATGQRRNTLATRLKQHLGLSNATTYAMHLQRWARDVPGGIKITAWQYPLGVNRSMILAIEDALSEHRQPILGKRGSAR